MHGTVYTPGVYVLAAGKGKRPNVYAKHRKNEASLCSQLTSHLSRRRWVSGALRNFQMQQQKVPTSRCFGTNIATTTTITANPLRHCCCPCYLLRPVDRASATPVPSPAPLFFGTACACVCTYAPRRGTRAKHGYHTPRNTTHPPPLLEFLLEAPCIAVPSGGCASDREGTAGCTSWPTRRRGS